MIKDWLDRHPGSHISTDTEANGSRADFIHAAASEVEVDEGHYRATLKHGQNYIEVHDLDVTGDSPGWRVLRGFTWVESEERGVIIRLSAPTKEG